MSKPFRELRAALDPLVQLQLKKYDVPDFGEMGTRIIFITLSSAQSYGSSSKINLHVCILASLPSPL
jgi:hypothetical protein